MIMKIVLFFIISLSTVYSEEDKFEKFFFKYEVVETVR